MPTVKTASNSFESLNSISVEVGTNCPAGGDSGYGGRTIFAIHNDYSTDLKVSVNGAPAVNVDSISIELGGDTECDTFIDALEFALETLRLQRKSNELFKGRKDVQ